jgi:hypothetical protein
MIKQLSSYTFSQIFQEFSRNKKTILGLYRRNAVSFLSEVFSFDMETYPKHVPTFIYL